MAILPARVPTSRRCRPPCGPRRRAGSRASMRARRRSRPHATLPRTRSARSPSHEACMIRVVAFLIGATLLALGVVWLADRPGQVTVTWLGQRADTSVMVAIVGIGLVAVASVLVWSLLRFLFRSPKLFATTLRERR